MFRALFNWIGGLFRRKRSAPPVAFVWLLEEPRALDEETVKRLVSRALEIDFPAGPEGDDQLGDFPRFVVGELPSFMVKLDEHVVLVNCFPVPYVNDPERAAREIPESRLRQAVGEHRAWVSADLLGDYEGEALAEGLRLIGKIAAELADDRCLALVVTHTEATFVYTPELLEALRSDDPVGTLSPGFVPVTDVAPDDPDLLRAAEEARGRWGEFETAFRNPAPSQETFSVKLPISEGERTEHMWVSVEAVEGDTITGTLDNQPLDLQFIREGDRVRGRVAEVEDWIFMQDGQPVGLFSLKVLEKKSRR